MKGKIVFEANYRGYELNKTKKGKLGYFRNALDTLIDLSEAVLQSQVFIKPRALHYTLEKPDLKKMKGLSNFLDRQASQIAGQSGRPSKDIFYIVAYEEKKSGDHAHLYVFVDGWDWYDSETLKRAFVGSKFATKVVVHNRKVETGIISQLIREETGELLGVRPRSSKPRHHDLATDFQDFIERASYIAKVFTKREEGRKYTASRTPKIEPMEMPDNVVSLVEYCERAKLASFSLQLDDDLAQECLQAAWHKASGNLR